MKSIYYALRYGQWYAGTRENWDFGLHHAYFYGQWTTLNLGKFYIAVNY